MVVRRAGRSVGSTRRIAAGGTVAASAVAACAVAVIARARRRSPAAPPGRLRARRRSRRRCRPGRSGTRINVAFRSCARRLRSREGGLGLRARRGGRRRARGRAGGGRRRPVRARRGALPPGVAGSTQATCEDLASASRSASRASVPQSTTVSACASRACSSTSSTPSRAQPGVKRGPVASTRTPSAPIAYTQPSGRPAVSCSATSSSDCAAATPAWSASPPRGAPGVAHEHGPGAPARAEPRREVGHGARARAAAQAAHGQQQPARDRGWRAARGRAAAPASGRAASRDPGSPAGDRSITVRRRGRRRRRVVDTRAACDLVAVHEAASAPGRSARR